MPKVYVKTYGCQMNERDSEQVARMFSEGGYTVTTDENEADAVLINTCSVRDQAEQKALGKMGNLIHKGRDRKHVVYGFMGCMAQSRGEELFKTLPNLDVVVGTQKYHKVFEYVDNILQRRLEARMDDPTYSLRGTSVCDTAEEEGSQNTIRDHVPKAHEASAFVSIMQGCNMRCSFCIVPDTRGKERGRPISEIVGEVSHLAASGVKEITLLGQIVNLYGRTEFPKIDGKSPFVQLLEAVHEVDGIERIRFTSPHPIGYRDDLVAAFTYLPKLCSHIHFPMQSGSDKILREMRRPYKNEKFIEICEKMKTARPGLAITTDMIVGFPGETEEDFQATIDTDATDESNGSEASNAAVVGTRQQVLCEGPSKNNAARLTGRTLQNKIVIFDGDPARLTGQLLDIQIEQSTGFTLFGTACLEECVPAVSAGVPG